MPHMIEWFEKEAGGLLMQEQVDGAVMTVLGTQVGNWVAIPPELGGGNAKVDAVTTDPCPCKESGHHVQTVWLDSGHVVFECVHNGFLWCMPREEE